MQSRFVVIICAVALGACGSVNNVNDNTIDGGGNGDGGGQIDAAIDAPLDAPEPVHIVFVSSTTFPADLGGRDLYSVQCQMLAASAGLDGEFVALLHIRSNPLDNDDIAINGPVANTNGDLVALDAAEFYSGTLRAGNGFTEGGGSPADPIAWIGVPDQSGGGTIATCGDWGSTAGGGGQVNVTTNTWLTASSTTACTAQHSVQCISL